MFSVAIITYPCPKLTGSLANSSSKIGIKCFVVKIVPGKVSSALEWITWRLHSGTDFSHSRHYITAGLIHVYCWNAFLWKIPEWECLCRRNGSSEIVFTLRWVSAVLFISMTWHLLTLIFAIGANGYCDCFLSFCILIQISQKCVPNGPIYPYCFR